MVAIKDIGRKLPKQGFIRFKTRQVDIFNTKLFGQRTVKDIFGYQPFAQADFTEPLIGCFKLFLDIIKLIRVHVSPINHDIAKLFSGVGSCKVHDVIQRLRRS